MLHGYELGTKADSEFQTRSMTGKGKGGELGKGKGSPAMGNKVDGAVMARCHGGIVVVAVVMLPCAAFAGAGAVTRGGAQWT